VTTRIKICGITRCVDAEVVVAAGGDALGLNFAQASPRYIELTQAAEISGLVAGQLSRVGVFVDPSAAEVEKTLARVDLDLLQFHGQETVEFCRRFGVPYLKALRVREPFAIEDLEVEYADACALLLDAHVAGQPGGTGVSFDWNLWPSAANKKLVLAGGLHAGNVACAIRETRPYAVDVSGGVEGAVKGEKDAAKIQAFIAEVRSARLE
jgi:phosphoribosylanthranilate isomerase